MANIPNYHIDDLKPENQQRSTDILNKFMGDVWTALNGGVDFGSAGSAENTRTHITETINFTGADEEFSAAHKLGRVPNGVVAIYRSANASFYKAPGDTDNTSAAFFIKSDTVTLATFLVL